MFCNETIKRRFYNWSKKELGHLQNFMEGFLEEDIIVDIGLDDFLKRDTVLFI